MPKCKAMFTIVDDTDHEKSTWVVEYGPFDIENNAVSYTHLTLPTIYSV